MENGKPKQRYTEGAVGAGLVLVVMPVFFLFFGIDILDKHPTVGLPVLAIFGVMILFGSMALTSTLFVRLNLANREEALALPTGSIRAAIALSLIVLFAIISIMLFQSLAKPYRIERISEEDKTAIIKEPRNRVLAVHAVACPVTVGATPGAQSAASDASGTAGAAEAAGAAKSCYDVHLVQSAGQEAIDIAKQLLILVGTLMTSVTSFYFAARTAQPVTPAAEPASKTKSDTKSEPKSDTGTQPNTGQTAPASKHVHTEGDSVDGCDVPITDATPDTDLPAAKGGVKS